MDTTRGNKFCQFPQLRPIATGSAHRVVWQADRRLQQHWQRYLTTIAGEGIDNDQEAMIAQDLFQRRSPGAKLITQHWQAWLSRQGVKAARVLWAEVEQISRHQANPDDGLSELVQMALEFTVNVDGFFENFHPVSQTPTDWYGLLTAWTYRKIYGYLIDRLRLQRGQTFKRSDLGLAARATRKRVIDALTETGLARLRESEQRIYQVALQIIRQTPEADCLAALSCCGNPGAVSQYQRVLAQWITLTISIAGAPSGAGLDDQRNPSTINSPSPADPDFVRAMIGKFLLYLEVWWHFKTLIKLKQVLTPQWSAIAAEQQRHSTLGLTVKPEQAEPIATVIGKAVRQYTDPAPIRVNLVQEDGQSLLENLADPHPPETEDDPDAPAPLWQTASQLMAEYLAQLDPITQQVAQKLYGDSLTQWVVASDLKLSQATIARYQRRILTGLIQLLSDQAPLPALSAQKIATLKPALIDWLQHHYQSSSKH